MSAFFVRYERLMSASGLVVHVANGKMYELHQQSFWSVSTSGGRNIRDLYERSLLPWLMCLVTVERFVNGAAGR